MKYENGNLVELTKKEGIINSYIWGYGRRYPVAKIQNVSFTSANALLIQNTIQNPSSDISLRTELDKIRQNFPSAMVTTYTYKPLFGLSSISDQNNKPSFYEYDKLGRRQVIRDKDQNIQKVFSYKYQSIQ